MGQNQTKNIKLASFSVLALSFVALMVFLSNQKPLHPEQAQAFKRTDHYASQLIEAKFMVKTESNIRPQRGLASVNFTQEALEGPVGLDPWGYTFNYLVKKDSKNPNKGVLVIWSSGADNKLETTRDMIAENHSSFLGDDFGKAYPFEI